MSGPRPNPGASLLRRLAIGAVLSVILAVGVVGVAEAHTSERAFILLLPTGLYLTGGTLMVALSFFVMALMPVRRLRAMEDARRSLGRLPSRGDTAISLIVAVLALALVTAGFAGSRDPLSNPLPTVVWTVWWVGLTFLHVVFGNLWAVLNPWIGPYCLLTALPGLRRWRDRPPFAYPEWAGHWPAMVLFLGFAWFELIHPAPQDPDLLAAVVGVYLAGVFVAMVLFGGEIWLQHGEPFTLFFRIVSYLSPFETKTESTGDRRRALSLRIPGMGLLGIDALPLAGTAFVLLVLASVSFDGLSRTFWYLDLIGENPLAYPGRTVLMGINTIGLVAAFLALGAAYAATVLLGRILAPTSGGAGERLGRFVVSIIPIAFGYHFAHYLPVLMLDGQYAWKTLSDPFALGWDLFGGRDWYVTASFFMDHYLVAMIWKIQVSAIVAAHVAAVAVSHFLALRDGLSLRVTLIGQAPLTALMIGYTLFGLWLLSSPAAG